MLLATRALAAMWQSYYAGVCATKLCLRLTQFADSIGLPTDEGLFGFKPFSEVWVGRLAMIGFLTSVVQEFLTGVLSPSTMADGG